MEVGRHRFPLCTLLYWFIYFWPHCSMWNFPIQGSNLCPLQWMHGFLTTGPPRGVPGLFFKPLKIKLDLRKGWSGWWPWGRGHCAIRHSSTTSALGTGRVSSLLSQLLGQTKSPPPAPTCRRVLMLQPPNQASGQEKMQKEVRARLPTTAWAGSLSGTHELPQDL